MKYILDLINKKSRNRLKSKVNYLNNNDTNKIKVAVFPCGSEVGLEINRSLRHSRHFDLIGLNSVEDNGRVIFKNYIGNLPFFKAENFQSELKKIIQKEDIRFLIPAMDEVGAFLKVFENELGCEVACADAIGVVVSKSKTYASLDGIVRTPKIYSEYDEILKNLPVFSKPDIGYGSKNTELVETAEQLNKRYLEEGLLFCEYLPGKEYTIDCFSNKSNEVLYSGSRERKRIRCGISVNTSPVHLNGIKKIAQRISTELKLEGIWFFQMKENPQNELVLLEVATRVSGSMALNRFKGVNLILLDLFQRLNYPICIEEYNLPNLELERAFDCNLISDLIFDKIYVDFDDCLVIDQKLNTGLIRFLYQQINKQKYVVLITKHEGDLKKRLVELRIRCIFDKIIHLKKNDHKFKYIQKEGSIFIDDSYQERKMVAENLFIPTFAPDIIDSLINNREI